MFDKKVDTTRSSIHPDRPDFDLRGVKVPNIKDIVDTCVTTHGKLMRHVPLCGFDVVLTDSDELEKGICLLEVNLSCNFFGGDFDTGVWREVVWKWMVECGKRDGGNKKVD